MREIIDKPDFIEIKNTTPFTLVQKPKYLGRNFIKYVQDLYEEVTKFFHYFLLQK